MNIRKWLYLVIGYLSLGLGCLGIVLPLLPTVPFFILTMFCFGKASPRLQNWFHQTSLYQKYMATYIQKKKVSLSGKIGLIMGITLLMGIGFWRMESMPIVRGILALIWICHVGYILFGIKTLTRKERESKEKVDCKK